MTAQSDVAKVAAQLGQKIDGLAQAVTKNRRFARWLAASVAFDIALSAGLGWNALQVDHAVDEARKASSSTRLACEGTNVTNAKNKELWEFAFSLGVDPNETPAAKTRREEFQAFIARTFVQSDCTKT